MPGQQMPAEGGRMAVKMMRKQAAIELRMAMRAWRPS
jgi:hypothetical protein